MSHTIDGTRPPVSLPSLPALGSKVMSAVVANTQGAQLGRLKQGVTNGSISEAEASRLLEQQARIASAIGTAQADGRVSLSELVQIKHLQLRAGLSLFEAQSNGTKGQPNLDRAATRRQAAQLGSIAQGVRSGSLTGSETAKLLTEQSEISSTLGNARADKKISPDEWLGHRIWQAETHDTILDKKSNAERAPHASTGK